ncbi:protein transport protein SEC16A [Sesamum angolense]|uniref:Protein transport protein sec16 n=1 Tax=Sesamum angolense TaxID=2727404 RepID=A0AAE1WA77_9LAMI|nr:protein transport protein SEC16A [Sesamum angolense]
MASNPPPFQVEDNTDEDFFDKLVNDDDDMDFKVAKSLASGAPNLTDGNESDEAKAFANLSINELEYSGEVDFDNISGSNNKRVDDLSVEAKTVEQINEVKTVEEIGKPLMPSNSSDFDNLILKPGDANASGAEVLFDGAVVSTSIREGFSEATTESKCNGGSRAPGVKEVEWSAFHADSAQNDSNGFGSYSDFLSEFGGDNAGEASGIMARESLNNGPEVAIGNDVHVATSVGNSNNYWLYNEAYNDGTAADQSSNVPDLNSIQFWENQYPGWKYDPNTGEWYQVDGYDAAASVQANVDSNLSSTWGVVDGQAELSYMQQTAQSVAGSVGQAGTTGSVTNLSQVSQTSDATESTTNWNLVSQMSGDSNAVPSDWNQASHDNNGYPPHMVFDPQYPGWYYDTIAQEWRPLESYPASNESTAQVQDQINQDGYASTDIFSGNNDQRTYSTHNQGNNYIPQGFGSQGQDKNVGSVSNYNQQSSRMWLPETVARSEATLPYSENHVMENHYGENVSVSAHGSQQSSGVKGSYYENLSQGQNDFSMASHLVGRNLGPHFSDSKINQNDQNHFLNDYYSNQNPLNFSQIQSAQISYADASASASGRSSAGHPSHALVAFGFGGKLIVMKHNNTSENMNFGSQNPVGGSISVLNLVEVMNANIDTSNHGMGGSNYFQALCRQSLPGPLSSGSVGGKELNKWIDERMTNLESADMDYRKAEVLRLLLSLLKIACQYYGKLRSPYGTDAVLKESDAPESAVAKLFASAKGKGLKFSQYGAVAQCLQHLPSEEQMLVTAAEVQNLLVSGRKKDALQCAQDGQLWGPALVLAAQLGDQFYVETVKQMALRQLVAGSPLRTLCLLIAGQPADVFSADCTAISSMPGAFNMPQQPAQFGANGMLDDWEENLAVITANRTKDDELVLIHLGDCLWKERSDIIAAHICYLVAEASFEPYSDTARLCLVGADHWKYPRTYASPEAIQFSTNGMLDDWEENLAVITANRTKDDELVLIHLGDCLWKERSDIIAAHICYLVAEASFEPYSDTARLCLVGADHWKYPRTYASPEAIQFHADNIMLLHGNGKSIPKALIDTHHLEINFRLEPLSIDFVSQEKSPDTCSLKLEEFGGRGWYCRSFGGAIRDTAHLEFRISCFTAGYGRGFNQGGTQQSRQNAMRNSQPLFSLQITRAHCNLLIAMESRIQNQVRIIIQECHPFLHVPVDTRYVDTFNQGGRNTATAFQSPSVPSVKPASGVNPKFFVPTPVSTVEQPVDGPVNSMQNTSSSNENPSTSPLHDSFESPAPPSSTAIQRFGSMNNLSHKEVTDSGSFPIYSRRTASWSGSFTDSLSHPPNKAELKPLGELLSRQPSSSTLSDPSLVHSAMNGGSFGDDLHEVEL